MSDLKNIDELFKNGAEKQYPVDENLWAKAESQLDAVYPVRKVNKGWIYISLALLMSVGIIYGISSFLQKDNSQTDSISQTQTNNTPVASIDNSITKSADMPNNVLQNETTLAHPDNEQLKQAKTIGQTSDLEQNLKKDAFQPIAADQPAMSAGAAVNATAIVSNASQIVSPSQAEERAPVNIASDNKDEANEGISHDKNDKPAYTPISAITTNAVTYVEMVNKNKEVGKEKKTAKQINPRLSNWFISLDAGYSHITNNTSANPIVEDNLWHTQRGGISFGVVGGYRLGRFSFSTGIGQSRFRTTYEATIPPEPTIDTISSYYALVTNEFLYNEKVVTLIERRYNTETVWDSNAKAESIRGESNISYITIPLQIGYTLPLDRFELTGILSSTFMVKPKFTHSAPANFASIMKQNEQAIRPSLIRPAIHVRLGYRLTTNFSVHAEVNAATTNQSMLVTEKERVNTVGFKLGIMTRF